MSKNENLQIADDLKGIYDILIVGPLKENQEKTTAAIDTANKTNEDSFLKLTGILKKGIVAKLTPGGEDYILADIEQSLKNLASSSTMLSELRQSIHDRLSGLKNQNETFESNLRQHVTTLTSEQISLLNSIIKDIESVDSSVKLKADEVSSQLNALHTEIENNYKDVTSTVSTLHEGVSNSLSQINSLAQRVDAVGATVSEVGRAQRFNRYLIFAMLALQVGAIVVSALCR
jgi:DNA repair exonuclease SbcCD ATPase subunit